MTLTPLQIFKLNNYRRQYSKITDVESALVEAIRLEKMVRECEPHGLWLERYRKVSNQLLEMAELMEIEATVR